MAIIKFSTIVGASFLADSVERVVLVSASTLSASMARTVKSGEELSKLSRVPQPESDCRRLLFAKGGTGGRGDWRRLSAAECGRHARRTAFARLLVAI